ncbi:D-3-phosphoglycerate dehydrogenase [Streptosporangium becharense]|uniref:D-3-phosphoglycerate dehydrogenase n=1 Tax=Streptosporangium becharense TaxID=1816182 RepID=A0A7W9MEK8_9ACTN|nr:C-terminal binding protein [Streptosporangium becharense]MBB2915033.1 D-3-phosphoglycerate dehydrogenase [Streptosporangium becharense]MBB5818082.1 D-3-phosphoglycerate dehydrogenase [Streptosporangium becharense]
MSGLVVLDTSYGDILVEQRAAAPLSVGVTDARRGGDLGTAEGVLVQYATIGAEQMDAHPTWRVIGRYGVGVDTIDLAAAGERGIAVVNVPDYCQEEVATHAVALILAANRRLTGGDRLVRDGHWPQWSRLRPVVPLSEQTLGLIGIGRIGAEVIRLAGPFFREVVAHDPAVTAAAGARMVDLPELLARADVVSLHCPLRAETRHILDERAFRLMKDGVTVVNVSRGGLIDSAALAAALGSGKVTAAGLDVLEDEPPGPDDPLLRAPNTVVTPHFAWYSETAEVRLRGLLAERCAAYLRGREVPSIVNATTLKATT